MGPRLPENPIFLDKLSKVVSHFWQKVPLKGQEFTDDTACLIAAVYTSLSLDSFDRSSLGRFGPQTQ